MSDLVVLSTFGNGLLLPANPSIYSDRGKICFGTARLCERIDRTILRVFFFVYLFTKPGATCAIAEPLLRTLRVSILS